MNTQILLPFRRRVLGRAEPQARRRPERPIWPVLAFAATSLLSSALAFVVVVYGYRWLLGSDTFAVHEIKISGNQRAATDELLGYLNVGPKESALALNLGALKANLLTHPWVKNAEVERVLPDTLLVRVTEHRPAGVVALGSLYVVDEDGEVFAHAQASELERFVPITGLERQWLDEDPGEWHRMLALAMSFQDAANDAGVGIGEIHTDEALGIAAELIPAGILARFGRGDFAGKLARLKKTRTMLNQQGRAATAFLLDNARHPDWVVVRLQKPVPKAHYGAR